MQLRCKLFDARICDYIVYFPIYRTYSSAFTSVINRVSSVDLYIVKIYSDQEQDPNLSGSWTGS